MPTIKFELKDPKKAVTKLENHIRKMAYEQATKKYSLLELLKRPQSCIDKFGE